MCFGGQLALESHAEPGKKPDWTLFLKTPTPNFGADIEINETLSSMNLEEVSRSLIYYGGSIVTQSLWRLKAGHKFYPPTGFGSHQI